MRHSGLVSGLIAAAALAAVVAAPSRQALAADCTGNWELFSSVPYAQIAFPDTGVTYWRYRFAAPAGSHVALKVTGQYAYARYVNFNIYDAKTANSSVSLPDVQIAPDSGSVNPYRPGVARAATPRSYTVTVVPAGSTHAAEPNHLSLPTAATGGGTQDLELWYRVYLPDPGQDGNGGVPLPTVAAVDDTTGEPAACPVVTRIDPPGILQLAGNLPPGSDGGKIDFYRPADGGLYANLDNLYLATRFGLFDNKVEVVRLRAPTFPRTGHGLATFDGQEDVRYWSFCLGGADQRTSSCVADQDLPAPGADGLTTIVVGPESVRATALAKGAAFLPWGNQILQILIYRNLLTTPGFAGDQAQVPQLPRYSLLHSVPADVASAHIGDWAPQGVECAVDAFTNGTCGGI